MTSKASATKPAAPVPAPETGAPDDGPVNYVQMEVERYRLKLETSALYDLGRKLRDRASKCEEEGETEIAAGLSMEAAKISASAKVSGDALAALEARRNRLLRAAIGGGAAQRPQA